VCRVLEATVAYATLICSFYYYYYYYYLVYYYVLPFWSYCVIKFEGLLNMTIFFCKITVLIR